MPSIDLSILNQRQTPAFYADVLANRPAAGFVGRIFISTNTFAFFRDNGTGWDLIGGPGTGTVTGSGAAGQVSFWNGASSITGSNDLFWDSVNGHLGIGTNVPGTALQIDHDQNQFIRLNQTTATNDTKIAFQNSGVALWRIGNSYNAGANDFGIYDVVGSIQPVTVKKTTGQVLIGTSTVGSGKLVVASATGDNHIQIVGAAAPSLRIDSAESGPTKRIGIGLATAVNNFIQNSQNLDMCIFNGSTSAAGNMLFGIYDTGLANIQEAARISSARNFLIGTITDVGSKLQVNGQAYINHNDASVLRILRNGGSDLNTGIEFVNATSSANIGSNGTLFGMGGTTGSIIAQPFIIVPSSSEKIRLNSNGNLLIGTTTDAGQKLQVNGTAFINGNFGFGQGTANNRIDVLIPNKVAILGTQSAINVDYTSANIGEFQTIGFSYSSSIGNTNQYWGMGFTATSFGGGSGDLFFFTNAVRRMSVKGNGVINISSIPTSAAGLASGDIYSNLGVLTIVP